MDTLAYTILYGETQRSSTSPFVTMNDSMEITQELQALPTESSHQPPPIPLVPRIPNSSPLTAPPPPPSNLDPSAKTTEGRQILKPVAPSKRPTIERPTQNCRNEFNIENAFLP